MRQTRWFPKLIRYWLTPVSTALSGRRRPLPPPLRLVIGLAGLVLIGSLLLMLPGIGSKAPLSPIQALFTATSALTVTGLSIIVPVQDLTVFGQIVLLTLIQVGGVGFMVVAVVVFWLLGRRVSLLNRLALCNSLGLVEPEAIVRLTQRIVVTVILIELTGAILLWLHWRDDLGNGQAILYALFHAISAFCNAGFDLFSGLPNYPQGIPADDLSLVILGSLIFMGGLGIPVLADLILWPRNQTLSLHSRVTLMVIPMLIIGGGIGMFWAESDPSMFLGEQSWDRRLLLSFFMSISARTAGFAAVPMESLAPPSQLLLMILMFIGTAPASMGGGITTGTFATLLLTLWGYVRGLPQVQIGGRSLSSDMVRKASAVLTVSLFVVMLASWLILISHPAELDPVLFEVISAFATCGLSLSFTDDLNLWGRLVIIAVMFWGRLGALTIVLALGQQQSRQLVTYPEESILIG